MCENIVAIMAETEQLEREILQERNAFTERRPSSFSYWLYELRVRKYWGEGGTQVCEKQLKIRLEDVIRQNYINMEDYPLDEVLRMRAEERIAKAEKWLRFL